MIDILLNQSSEYVLNLIIKVTLRHYHSLYTNFEIEYSFSSFRSSDVIRSGDSLSVDFSVPVDVHVRRLEHVEVVANIEYPVRGALEVALVSPKGEKVHSMSYWEIGRSIDPALSPPRMT